MSAADIFKKYSEILISSPNYHSAAQNLIENGVKVDFDINRYSILGHKWKEAIYSFITGDTSGGILKSDSNSKLASELSKIESEIISLGFQSIPSPEGQWSFFDIPGYKPDGAKNKIHVKVPTDKLNLMIDLAKLIKSNYEYFRQFKFAIRGNSFASRRDNFVIYLSKMGEEHTSDIVNKIKSMGLGVDTGEDYKGSKGTSLSQTELLSLRLSAILVNKTGAPKPSSNFASLWQITEKEFVENDPIIAKYIKPTQATAPAAAYEPKTLTLQTKHRNLNFNIKTQLGRSYLQSVIGEEAKFFSDVQFELNKSNQGWILTPNNSAVNKTVVNDKIVNSATLLHVNDIIGIIGSSGNKITPFKVVGV